MQLIGYLYGLLFTFLKTFGKRILGIKKHPQWDIANEMIWASTRYTFLASRRFGLVWLKRLGSKFEPKSSLAREIDVQEAFFREDNILTITPKKSSSSKRMIVYFHGGGYVLGSPKSSIQFLSHLAVNLETIVIAPDYPKAPGAQYPDAHEYSFKFLESVLNDQQNSDIYLTGDSAGGALVLSSFINLSEESQKRIKGCILISPWIDPLAETGSIQTNALNDVGDRDFVVSCYEAYVQSQQIEEKYPLDFLNRNLPELPPTFISIGDMEILYDQAIELGKKLEKNYTRVTTKVYPGMFHTFWNLAPQIKAANTLLADIKSWMG